MKSKVADIEKLSQKEITKLFSEINPMLPILVTDITTYYHFVSHYDYFTMWSKRIKTWIRHILPMYDIIHDETFKEITEIYDYLENLFDFEYKKPGNEDLSFLATTVYELNKKAQNLQQSFRNNYKGYQNDFITMKEKETLQVLKVYM